MIIKREIIQQEEIKLRTFRIKDLEDRIANQQNEPIEDSFFYEINKDDNKSYSYLLKLTFGKEIFEDDSSNEEKPVETAEKETEQNDMNNGERQESISKQPEEDNSPESVVAEFLYLPKIEQNKEEIEEGQEVQPENNDPHIEHKTNHGFVELSVVVASNGIFHVIKESKTRYNEKLQKLIALLAYKKCLTLETIQANNLEVKEVEQNDIDSTINYLDFLKSENIKFDIEDVYTFRNSFDIKSISSIVTHEEKLCFAISILHMRIFSTKRYSQINGKDYAAITDRFINSYEDDFYNEFTTDLIDDTDSLPPSPTPPEST